MLTSVYLLGIFFIGANGTPGAAFDKNVHATEASCQAKAEHLIKSAPAQQFQQIRAVCQKMNAPVLPVEEGPEVGENT